MARPPHDWQSVAEQVCKETDSEKLSNLVSQLCRALDERNQKSQSNVAGPTPESR